MKLQLIIFVFIGFSTFTCKESNPNNEIDEGTIQNNIYKSEEIGWEIEIPDGWEIVTMEESDAFQKKGLDIMEPMLDENIDVSKLRNLLSFKKNMFNLFQSTSEPYEIEYDGEWEENNKALREFLLDAYQQEGIEVTASDITTEIIDGLKFYTYTFSLYDKNGNVILNQIMYSRWHNGFDFGVNINYNDEDLKTEMLTAFRNSKFRKIKKSKS